MGKARFEMLGIEMKLPRNMVYHDDGFQDPYRYLRELELRYNRTTDLPNLSGAEPLVDGRMQSFQKGSEIHVHIWIRDLDSIVEFTKKFSPGEKFGLGYNNVSIRAHEETHTLQTLGGLHLLADRFIEDLGLKVLFDEIVDREVVANLGSVYALTQRKMINPLDFKTNFTNYITPSFADALIIVNEASERTIIHSIP